MSNIIIPMPVPSIQITSDLLEQFGFLIYEHAGNRIAIEYGSVRLGSAEVVVLKFICVYSLPSPLCADGMAQYFSNDNHAEAIDCFLGRLMAKNMHQPFGDSKTLDELIRFELFTKTANGA